MSYRIPLVMAVLSLAMTVVAAALSAPWPLIVIGVSTTVLWSIITYGDLTP